MLKLLLYLITTVLSSNSLEGWYSNTHAAPIKHLAIVKNGEPILLNIQGLKTLRDELQSELGNFINNEKIIIILKSINNSIKLVFSFNQGNQIFNILNIKEFLTYSRNLIETQLESRRRRSVPMTFSSYLRNRGNRNVKILLNLFNKLGTNKQNSINGLIALLNYSSIKDVLNGRSTYNQKNLFSNCFCHSPSFLQRAPVSNSKPKN